MCGFAGIYSTASRSGDEMVAIARRMVAPLTHRGPDDGGDWADAASGIAFGFRRLAIVDLSEHGHQPMRSASGRYWMVFNGEVYNFRELRTELVPHGFTFRGHSDSEVILAAFEHWGIESAVQHFVGMFAIAVWDTRTRNLTLLRDRMGIKPLFIYARPGFVSFGSELKALLAGPEFDRTVDRDALADYLRHLYVPAPRTIFQAARKLPPGHLLTICDVDAPLPPSRPFWSVEAAASAGALDPFTGSEREATDELERLLFEATRMRTVADVPLGAFLSGGIDSSTVVAMLQAASSSPVKTFSIAFQEQEYNEAPYAAEIARHLGTEHTELTVTANDALSVVPRLPDLYDEPFADPSQIPTYLVSSLARRSVTVALSGDGGDEVFGGYNRYTYGERIFGQMLRVPSPARRLAAAGIGSVSAASWDSAHRVVQPVLPRQLRQRLPGLKLQKLGTLLGCASPAQMYLSLVSAWQDPQMVVRGGSGADDRIARSLARPDLPLLNRMLLADQAGSLPDDQLAKVDRASMGVSLEVRVPILDHRVVEFSWRLPTSLKVREGRSKWLLRQVLYRHVPEALVERPKMGFSVPIGFWLRGPLRDWAAALLTPEALERDGLLHPQPIHRAWRQVQAGRDEVALGLWAVLMFQAWRGRWLG